MSLSKDNRENKDTPTLVDVPCLCPMCKPFVTDFVIMSQNWAMHLDVGCFTLHVFLLKFGNILLLYKIGPIIVKSGSAK